jgi:hypothetical protein
MAAISAMVGVIGLGISAASAFMSYSAQQKQAEMQAKALQLQQQAEKSRQQQMNLEAMRKKREIVRNAIAARSEALAVGTAQGSAGDGSSALPGAYGGISGQSTGQLQAVNQNQQIGNNIFSLHRQMYGAYQQAASAGSDAAMWSGIGSLGGMLMKNNTTIGGMVGGTA